MTYLKWNNMIANYFFNETMAGKEVLLSVDESLINEIGREIGEELSDFILSVVEGPEWVNNNFGICHKAMQTFNNWRSRKLAFPPYIGYLALFVLAGYTEEAEFSQIAYYPKLRALLGEDEGRGQYASFDKMIKLWIDLEKWSVEDKLEELGRFQVRIRGRHRHIGLPLSQTTISSNERINLPLIFYRADMISSDYPDTETLCKVLLKHGQDILSKKTVRLLSGEEKNIVLLQALIDLVKDELQEWDGALPEEFVHDGTFAKTRMKICLILNKISEKATFSIRINAPNEFPSGKLEFKRKGDPSTYNCRRSIDNWSTEIKDAEGITLDAYKFDWKKGEHLEDSENKWRAVLKGSQVRVFIQGKKIGLPNFIETARIEKGSRFILLCSNQLTEKITDWGQSSCDLFKKIDYAGVPINWSLFQGLNPKESCKDIKELSLSSDIKIRLLDGIRLGKGNTFLSIAPPKIQIENCTGNENVLLNDKPLEYDTDIQQWIYKKEELDLDETITIKVLDQGNEIRRTNFKLTNSKIKIRNKESFISLLSLNEVTKKLHNIGVNLINSDINILDEREYVLPTYLSNEIYFIGQYPGQVHHWQGKTAIELEWEVIWAIWRVNKRQWKVHFCSKKRIEKSNIKTEIKNKKNIKNWKIVMCKMKKTIEKPKFKPLQELWDNYLEVAKSV